MNEAREQRNFKHALEKLIKGFVEALKPSAAVPYLGASHGDPLEHTTRAEFIDNILIALGWMLKKSGGEVIEEARIKDETTLFLDYLGVNPDTRAPQLIVEAKAWSKPMVAASDAAAATEDKSTSFTPVSLIAAAIEHCKAGGATEASPVTAEWARWIAKLRDYVVGTHANSGHTVYRIREVSRQFVALCRDIDLLDASVVAIDGSKFKAVNAKARSFTREKLRRRLGELDRADEVLDKTGMVIPEARISRVNKKLAHFKKEADSLRAIEQRMDTTGETQVSLTDPDARAMATTSKQPRVVGYNVQNVVETKHHLIVAHEVTNLGYDREALSMMAHAAKEVMASDTIEAIADKGYYKGEEIVAAEQAGVAVIVSKPNTSNAGARGRFDKADFTYLAEENAYLCPAGERLTYRFTNEEAGRTMHSYWTNACATCAIKHNCTTGEQRRVKRWEHEAILERVQRRLDDDPAKIPLRSKTVEHPFGTIKAWMGATHFKMKTLKNVATEMALHVLAYNMMRVMVILGVPGLIKAMRA